MRPASRACRVRSASGREPQTAQYVDPDHPHDVDEWHALRSGKADNRRPGSAGRMRPKPEIPAELEETAMSGGDAKGRARSRPRSTRSASSQGMGRKSVPLEWRREMSTIRARARSEGRTTPAGRPDGLGRGHEARGHRAIRARLGTAAPHRMGREPQRQRLAYSPALRADEARRIPTFASPRL